MKDVCEKRALGGEQRLAEAAEAAADAAVVDLIADAGDEATHQGGVGDIAGLEFASELAGEFGLDGGALARVQLAGARDLGLDDALALKQQLFEGQVHASKAANAAALGGDDQEVAGDAGDAD